MRPHKPMTIGVLVLLAAGIVSAGDAAKSKREPIYMVDGKGTERVDQALNAAGRENKRILLTIGGNWCSWCYKLHDLFRNDKAIATVLRNEYEVVLLDSEKDKRALEKWQIKPVSYPYLAVLDSAGKKLTEQETGVLEIGDRHDPNKVMAFLEKWKASPLDANEVFAAALTQAKKEDKRVFVRLGAPWCGWCRRLDAFLVLPKIETILKKDYVLVKIDQERMKHGEAMARQLRKPDGDGGIPWFAFLDKDGRTLITSTKPGSGNIGFPVDPNTEIPHFLHMLRSTRSKITDAEIESVRSELAKPSAQ